MPKISVIMPVYNAKEEWLRQAIESILNQTYPDFEFLIIDDGSTNNTPIVLKEYSAKDNRIKIIIGEHKGISFALNKGFDEAKGEYIARMDCDDISLPQRFEKQVKFLEENTDVSVLGTAICMFPKEKKFFYPQNIRIFDVINYCPVAHPSVMIRKSDFDKHNLRYDNNFKSSEDYELWSRVIKHLQISNLTDVLLRYRNNPNGNSKNIHTITNDSLIKQRLMSLLTTDKNLQNKVWDLLDNVLLNKIPIKSRIFGVVNMWKRGEKYKCLYLLGICIPLCRKGASDKTDTGV